MSPPRETIKSSMSETVTKSLDYMGAEKYAMHYFGRGAGKLIGKATSGVVQPVFWLMDGMGDPLDVALWGAGFAARAFSPVGWGLTFASIAKSVIQDEIEEQLVEAVRSEPKKIRPILKPVIYYDLSCGDRINALKIVAAGGTAWEHENGLWLYAEVPDRSTSSQAASKRKSSQTKKPGDPLIYHPRSWQTIYTPKLPLNKKGKGYELVVLRRN